MRSSGFFSCSAKLLLLSIESTLRAFDPTLLDRYLTRCKYPLWGETDLACGINSYNAARLATANVVYTPLQAELLSTTYLWYSDSPSVERNEQAFLTSIAMLTKKYPNETDIRVWYGLSLLNVATQTEFESEIEPEAMLEARKVLEEALIKEPHHPGALHYLIHAYDVARAPIAEGGRKYAILYGDTVKTASHAQHMASHIWMRTGDTQPYFKSSL
jgi:hypothetical protein